MTHPRDVAVHAVCSWSWSNGAEGRPLPRVRNFSTGAWRIFTGAAAGNCFVRLCAGALAPKSQPKLVLTEKWIPCYGCTVHAMQFGRCGPPAWRTHVPPATVRQPPVRTPPAGRGEMFHPGPRGRLVSGPHRTGTDWIWVNWAADRTRSASTVNDEEFGLFRAPSFRLTGLRGNTRPTKLKVRAH